MIPGFLPFARNSTFMMDVVTLAMVLVIPILAVSIAAVKRGNFLLHKRLQTALVSVLAVAVVLFEVEIRMVGGWRYLARESPYLGGILDIELYIHLFFSIGSFILWAITSVLAWKRFANPPKPGSHSSLHKKLGWASSLFMVMTSVTGWLFYYLAFVARK